MDFIKAAKKNVCKITTTAGNNNYCGTGFLFCNNWIITIGHVLDGEKFRTAKFQFLNDNGDQLDITVNANPKRSGLVCNYNDDQIPDIAVIQLTGEEVALLNRNGLPITEMEEINIYNSKPIHCVHFGNELGLPVHSTSQQSPQKVDDMKFTHRLNTADGSSGFPILDNTGQIIGLHSAEKKGIPIHKVWEVLLFHRNVLAIWNRIVAVVQLRNQVTDLTEAQNSSIQYEMGRLHGLMEARAIGECTVYSNGYSETIGTR